MASAEERARREAVARVLAGQPAAKVAADLGRSDRWVRKWVARFDPSEASWAADRSRAPATVVNRTPAELERVVLAVRQRLMDDPWAQVGAAAIAWELTKLGLEPPAVWTIDRILRRAGVAKRRARGRYVPKGTPYPAGRAVVRPGARQEIDLIGPRYLAGATAFHALNAVDVGRRCCGIEILASKEERAVAEGLVRLWRRLGVPKLAQFDNGQTLQGRGRVLACRSGCVWPLGSGCASSLRRAVAQRCRRALQ
jgi:transposase